MPSPIKSPNSPYWQYDFQVRKRRFYGSTGCTARGKAQDFINKLRQKIIDGGDIRPPITLDNACAIFWKEKGQFDKSSKTTDFQIEKLCSVLGTTKFLSEITQQNFRNYVARRRAEVANASVNRDLEVARRIWKHLRSGGYDVPGGDSPNAIDWGDLMLPEPKERVRELLPDEEKRLFEKLPRDLAAIVEFAMLSGQRRSAVIGLLRARVDLDGMRASVHTKGDVWHTFPLTERMAELIRAQPTVKDCAFVFTYECQRPSPARKDRPRRYKGQRYPFSKQGWMRQWRKALADAKIEDFRFHDLRHTRATRVVRATGNLKAAQKLLGHSNISTTARYAHVIEEDLRRAMAAGESRNNHGKSLTANRRKRRISKSKG